MQKSGKQWRKIKAVKCFICCKDYDQVHLTTRTRISLFGLNLN